MLSVFHGCPAIILHTKEEIKAFRLLLFVSSGRNSSDFFGEQVPEDTEYVIVKLQTITVEILRVMARMAQVLRTVLILSTSSEKWKDLASQIGEAIMFMEKRTHQ
jgi:hypothetical protein